MTTSRERIETTVIMPALGESVEAGTVTRWLCNVGDQIGAEQPLLEVATDKVDTEIPAPCEGILSRILAEVDAIVAVGEPLAVITAGTAAADQPASPAVDATISNESAELADTAEEDAHVTNAHAPIDVAVPESSSPPQIAAAPGPPGSHTDKLPRIRRTIAQRMVESLQTAAQLTTVVEADVTSIARLRARHNDRLVDPAAIRLSFLSFFTKAAVDALAEHRKLNASLNDEVTEVTYHGVCHLGIAVDTPKGLMVPVIRDAGNLSVVQLGGAIATMADRVRAGAVTADELIGATFTVTNTGSRGALFDTPIINQPQTGILGTGSVIERLVPVRDGDGSLRIEVRSMVYLSLSYDHRIVDGADAARFLTAVKSRLEHGFDDSDLR